MKRLLAYSWAVLFFVAAVLAATHLHTGGSRHAASATSASPTITSADSPTPSPTDTHTPQATIERLPKDTATGLVGPDGAITLTVPPSDIQPVTSGLDAVNAAWGHVGDIHPSKVVANFALFEGAAEWVVSYEGLCFTMGGGPPGPGRLQPDCNTELNVEIDANNGQWLADYWYR